MVETQMSSLSLAAELSLELVSIEKGFTLSSLSAGGCAIRESAERHRLKVMFILFWSCAAASRRGSVSR